jgi:NADPH-dependent glutamate synthase beta subunit-like oxidoreductase
MPTGDYAIDVEVPGPDYWRRQINCQHACPVNTDARGYVRAIADGDFEGAYLIARGPNPLASICGRVCGAPCEAACRRGDIDQPISIRALKRFVTEKFGAESGKFEPLSLLRRVLGNRDERQCSGKEELGGLRRLLRGMDKPADGDAGKVAIIGSGPAGLAAAHDLALLGVAVTVFEMEPVPAGMLAVGIPAYRLPRELIAAEVEVIKALGVEFRCNTQVGKDITLDEIRRDYDATIIAVGAKRSRRLPIEGIGDDVLGGVEFLREMALNQSVDLGHRVVVIGGGNVAYDVSRSVIRQTGVDVSRSALRAAGVREVNLVSLESLEELPADDIEIIEGDEEGVVRHHRLGPKRIVRDADGKITAVEFQRVLRVFDENRRFAPQFDETQTTVIEADTVILTIGQQPDLTFVPEDGDIHRTDRGMLECDAARNTTSAPDVFVAGDIAYGPRLLIHAVASGKQCAREVFTHLTKRKVDAEQVMLHLPILDYRREADYEKQPRIAVPTLEPHERRDSFTTVVERGYSQTQAMCEASRCLDCGVNTIFDSDKCILCGGCADVCPELCLRLVSVSSLARTEQLQGVLDQRYDAGELEDASAIIKDETKCIRCALCAQRCPVGAITMERMTFENAWLETSA